MITLSPAEAGYLNAYFELVVPAARKWYVSGQGLLFKMLSTQSLLQALGVYNRNFRTLVGAFKIHAARALQSHDLSGEGINFRIRTFFFDHTGILRASPAEGSAQCRGHLRDNGNMKDDTHHSHTHSC